MSREATRAPGRAIATMLAEEGWDVRALGRDRIALVEMHGEHKIVPLAMDLTDRAYVCAIAEGLAIDSGFQPHIIERQEDGYGT